MLWVISALLALAGTVTAALEWEFAPKDAILSTINSGEPTLVAFIAPWTEPGTALLPEWNAGVAPISIPHIVVDCNDAPSTCADLGVHSYPAIRMYHGSDKEYTRYRGPRIGEAITGFVIRMTMPPITEVSEPDLPELKILDDVVFVAHLKDGDEASKKQIQRLANANYIDHIFAITTDPRAAEANGVKVPALVAYKRVENDASILALPADYPTLEKFVKESATPIIGELTRRTEMGYLSAPKILAYFFVSNQADRITIRKTLHQLAKQYAQYVSFVTIDSQEYADVAAKLGVDTAVLPALALYSAWKDQVFLYLKKGFGKGGIESKEVEEFLLEVLQGKRQPEGANAEKSNVGKRNTEKAKTEKADVEKAKAEKTKRNGDENGHDEL